MVAADKLSRTTARWAAFSRYEFLIAWRYLRARRAEGGVSVDDLDQPRRHALAVAALIITLAVRSGVPGGIRRHDPRLERPCDALLASFRSTRRARPCARLSTTRRWPSALPRSRGDAGRAARARAGHGQFRRAECRCRGVSASRPTIWRRSRGSPSRVRSQGAIGDFGPGVAVGEGVARELGLAVGDPIRLISPSGVRTAFGTSPRVSAYEVAYIFSSGALRHRPHRGSTCRSRRAQVYFDREGVVDELEIMVEDPRGGDELRPALIEAGGPAHHPLDLARTAPAPSCARSRSRTP